MYYILCIMGFLCIIHTTNYLLPTAYAISDPLSVPNNKFGIHIISASPDESSPAASLVNTNGDWGYITVIITQKDKNKDKWQEFFNDLRRRHLIPIVRIASETSGQNWKRPDIDDGNSWADFLNSLNWPVKNRYVVIFNEPNQGKEWGGVTDARSYARVLDKWISALKSRSEDFFVLNAGFDASSPHEPPIFEEEALFLQQMNSEVPGIFNKLDGWVSHSYPNPAFAGSPDAIGRGTIRTWVWEIQQLRSLGVSKDLPIFITEAGWKHAEGLVYDPRLPKADKLADYYKNAYENAWGLQRIVAVTPFLLNYQEIPFDHFSFKKNASAQYYSFYETIKNLPKTAGKPIQTLSAKLMKGEVYSSIVAGQTYSISLTFKNIGQSIWDEKVKLVPIQGGAELGIQTVEILENINVEPGEEYTFTINLKAPEKGRFSVRLNLFEEEKQFESNPLEFTTEVKLPVILQVLSSLKWKNNPAGEYILRVSGAVGDSSQKVNLDNSGKSPEIKARYLLPDYTFEFSLEKPYYHPKTIKQTVTSGINTLDFGTLQPALLPALLNPKQFWQLLPFSN